jgi:hypothetical protein
LDQPIQSYVQGHTNSIQSKSSEGEGKLDGKEMPKRP